MSSFTNPNQVLDLAREDPEYTELLKYAPFPDVSFEDVPKMRKEMEAMHVAKAHRSSGVVGTFKTRNGNDNQFLSFKPTSKSAQPGCPLIVLIYGGGFVTGSISDMAPVAETLSMRFRAVVLCPQYRLAPEHKFPTAPQDIWDFMLWLAENIESTGADPHAGFVIGGVSAGGNLAAVTAQKAIGPAYPLTPTAVYLGIPVLFNDGTVPAEYRDVFLSRGQNSHARILNAEAIRQIEGYYGMDYTSPEFCPIFTEDAGIRHPKTYFQIAGQDPLRDDGLIYERILRAQGTPTRMDVYRGVPHGFSGVLPTLKVSQQANADLVKGFEWCLQA